MFPELRDDDDDGNLANPPSGYLWDACRRAGLTYRSYGEYGKRVSDGKGGVKMEARVPGLVGHMCPDYGISKDGKNLFGRIRTVKEGGGPAKGDLFTFAYRVKGDTLTITDLKGTGAIALAQALQGEYKKVGGKKG